MNINEKEEYKEAIKKITKLNKLYISLKKAQVRTDLQAVRKCLAKIEEAVKSK